MTPFDKWWNNSKHSEEMDCFDPRQVAKDAWDSACIFAVNNVIKGLKDDSIQEVVGR